MQPKALWSVKVVAASFHVSLLRIISLVLKPAGLWGSCAGHKWSRLSLSFLLHAQEHAHLNIQACVLQLVLDSNDEDPQVDCTVSVLDAEGGVSDTQVLQFAVHANPPGEVCPTGLCTQWRKWLSRQTGQAPQCINTPVLLDGCVLC